MDMEIGSETQRQIIIKYRQRLKAGLAEHEVISKDDYRQNAHLLLLVDLCELVERENERYRNTQ